MVISATGIVLYAKVSPLYNVIMGVHCFVYYKKLTGHCMLSHWTLLMCKISDLYLLWFFEILRFKLKKKNWRELEK